MIALNSEDATGEVTALLRQLIRNECVNDGSRESGHETRSVDVLEDLLNVEGIDLARFRAIDGRDNLVARIEGSDASAPSLLLMGHTDVVPANADHWHRDPFGGELVDADDGAREVWGRGAVDMLNLTASMAVAMRRLAASQFAPRGTLIYLAVADEEALGTWGADHLVNNERDAVLADYVITESGGIPIQSPKGVKLPVIVGEKGTWWCTLRITGTAGHASQPFRTDNALVKAAEIVRRLADYRPPTMFHDVWRRFIGSMDFPEEMSAPLLREEGFTELCDALPLGMGRQFHACTHNTIAPTIIAGGTKTNVIPDTVDLQLDIRTLPGQVSADVRQMLDDALGDMAGAVEIIEAHDDPSTASPIETPLWDTLSRVTKTFYGDSATVPFLTVGATDARFFRRAGSTAYGFGLFSQRMSIEDYGLMFHGDDERVDVESLRLSTELWQAVAHDLLG